MTKNHNDRALLQIIKFGIVGAMNTLLTLAVIFICKSLLGINPYVSNAIGYVVGVVNSFIWSKQWVFHGKGRYHAEAAKFLLGFALCYGVQLLIVWAITQSSFGDNEYDLGFFVISGYGIATIIGNVVYSGCNFIYNRVITFNKK